MKAIVIERYGGTEVFLTKELPFPQIKKNEILVQIYACGLNPVDYKIRAGFLKDLFPVSFPHILGGDISGKVKAVGNDVHDFKIGDEVYFSNPLDKNGGYAELCVVNAEIVAHKPKSLSYVQSAALPVAGLTSIQALRGFSKIRSGQKVLIHAGAGGVGSFAIQYAKHMGAKVYTTTSRENHSYVYELGADVAIDYRKEDFVSICQNEGGMDIVLESIGGDNYFRSVLATRTGGFVPCIVNPPDVKTRELALQKKITTDFFLLTSSRNDLDEITKMIESQKIRPLNTKTLSFGDIVKAHEQLESGRTRGKLILEVQT